MESPYEDVFPGEQNPTLDHALERLEAAQLSPEVQERYVGIVCQHGKEHHALHVLSIPHLILTDDQQFRINKLLNPTSIPDDI